MDDEVAFVVGAVLQLAECGLCQVNHILHGTGLKVPDIKDRWTLLIAKAGRHEELPVLDEQPLSDRVERSRVGVLDKIVLQQIVICQSHDTVRGLVQFRDAELDDAVMVQRIGIVNGVAVAVKVVVVGIDNPLKRIAEKMVGVLEVT